MALIKKSELNKMNEKQLIEKRDELNRDLIRIRTQIASKVSPDNPGQVKHIKRTIARINTRLNVVGRKING